MKSLKINPLSIAVVLAFGASTAIQAQNTEHQLETIVITAEQQVKQSLGVSTITQDDLQKLPVTNDIAEYVRRMPGVNLTGNSATGQRGNQRQIDIRGMGPENTLIMIDGKPVNSRNSVRYGWRGERDTRGDSNWVPVDAIESIEVLRGPAAARYGSGAMGGVVNIKTKKVSNEFTGSIDLYTHQPENTKEGDTKRISANVALPIIKDVLSARLYGNFNKTEGDAADINPLIESVGRNGQPAYRRAAGREGVKNQDAGLKLAWQINPNQTLTLDTSFGRQGNAYAGDTQNSSTDAGQHQLLSTLIGKETNTMYRDSYSLQHDGLWSGNISSRLTAQYDKTRNRRLNEGLAGSGEGTINSQEFSTSMLNTLRLNGEVSIPFTWFVPQVVTLGSEYVNDEFSDKQNTSKDQALNSALSLVNTSELSSEIVSAYVENNVNITDSTNVVFALRYDQHNKSGDSWNPALNITQKLGQYWTIKGGIAKAYKVPNMYQNAEGYLLRTGGNGCPLNIERRCLLQGNGDLQPETAINKELGVQFENDTLNASVAWFRNDYKNKIGAGDVILQTVNDWNVIRWQNIPEALIEGVEGNVTLKYDNATWTNNVTYMLESVNKKSGNPLSIIPNYTWNSILNYQFNDKLDINFVYTQYGRQKSRKFAEARHERSGVNSTAIKSYGLASLNVGYRFNDHISAKVGINNLFDEKKLRDNRINQTYNEPGRAYYATIKYQF